MKLIIKTFGVFDIRQNGNTVLKKSKQNGKITRLLQYFIAFRNSSILPETVMENLFSKEEYTDPKSALSTQIYRLRKLLKNLVPEGEEEEKYITLNLVNGKYILVAGEFVDIDVDKFENLIKQGSKKLSENKEMAIEKYQQALEIYEGFFLAEYTHEVWLIPLQNYYSRLYLKAVDQTIKLLKEKENYEKITKICEKALYFVPYDEDIHIFLMEAMLKLGQFTNVVKHYKNIVNLLNEEMDISSSPKLDEFYEKIESKLSEKSKMTAIDFWNRIELEETEGAQHCDYKEFKAIIDNERRKSDRKSKADYVIFLTREVKKDEDSIAAYWVEEMARILKNTLRKGDIFTFWNERQILILLSEVKKYSPIIERRLRNKIRSKPKLAKISININSNPLAEKKLDEKEIVE